MNVSPRTAAGDMEICRLPQLLRNLVLVDGPARTGKTTVSRLMSSFHGVELERVQEVFDNIGYMSGFGKIDRDAAAAMLRAAADMDIYNLYLSRNVNCRPGDQTGILKSARTMRYIRRMFAAEGELAEQRILDEQPILMQHVHYQLERIGIFFEAFADILRVVEVIRHPADLVAASKSRFAQNLCDSLRGVYLGIRHGETAVPVFAHGWEDEYLRAGPTDRVIRITHGYLVRSLETYHALAPEQRQNVRFVKYETLLNRPQDGAAALAAFLGTETTGRTAAMTRELARRDVDIDGGRDRRLRAIRDECTPQNFERLEEMITLYDGIDG